MAFHRAMYDKLVNLMHFSTVMDVFTPYMCAFQQRVFVAVCVFVYVCVHLCGCMCIGGVCKRIIIVLKKHEDSGGMCQHPCIWQCYTQGYDLCPLQIG